MNNIDVLDVSYNEWTTFKNNFRCNAIDVITHIQVPM